MFQAHLSTLFFIFSSLGLGLVTISVIAGTWALWISTTLFSLLLLSWLLYETKPRPPEQKELGAQFLNRKLGWYQNVTRYFQTQDHQNPVTIEFYIFKKPELLLSQHLLEEMPLASLQICLLYFCEVSRILDSNLWSKIFIIFSAMFGQDTVPFFDQAKEKALNHLQTWHGLDPVIVRVRLQQAQYFYNSMSLSGGKQNSMFFNRFPNSLPKGVPL
jgi:hypothetical protein